MYKAQSVNVEILQGASPFIIVHAGEPHVSGEDCVNGPPHSRLCLFLQGLVQLERPGASGSGGCPDGKFLCVPIRQKLTEIVKSIEDTVCILYLFESIPFPFRTTTYSNLALHPKSGVLYVIRSV